MAGSKGRSGRRKKPAAQKKREGTFRADRDHDAVEFPADCGPEIPAGLHPDAVAEWKRLAPLCQKLGLLTDGDWIAWRLGFAAFSTWLHATEKLTSPDEWKFVTESGYEQMTVEVQIAKQAATAVMQFCREFGLTPSSRSSLDIDTAGKGPTADPMGDLLN